MRRVITVVLVVAVVGGLGWWLRGLLTPSDPYLWLEDIHGEKSLAWVKDQNARTLKTLGADPDYQHYFDFILTALDSPDRIPFGGLEHQYVFNFWRDAANPKGIWRRTTIADYAGANPQWETLLDLDKLSADEHTDWVYKGRNCSPSLTRCLIMLSPGGSDAIVVREYDLATKSFVKDGFDLAPAKSYASYIDDDTVIFATNFGAGSLTGSGYPRIVKLWKRGQAIANATPVFEGKHDDVVVDPFVYRTKAGGLPVIVEETSFFDANYFIAEPGKAVRKADLPADAVLQGYSNDRVIATLRQAWTPAGSKTAIPAGALVAENALSGTTPDVAVLYTPSPRTSIDQILTGRDAVYAAIYDNVAGHILAFRFDAARGSWTTSTIPLPPNGSVSIASANDFGPEVQYHFENFLTPATLFADAGDGKPVAIKSGTTRFDASTLVTEQFDATSKDGTKIPYFVVRPRVLTGPAPTALFGYGGFSLSMTPGYLSNFGPLWLAKGGIYVLANIRGGGEFGPAWHDAALKENRQKAFDDFEAVAADIETRGLTTPRQLGIVGASNGGLLVTAAIVQRPELFGAVVAQVPLIDMLRYTQIGAGASWIDEYGDPARSENAQRNRGLFAVSECEGGREISVRSFSSLRPATTASRRCLRARWRRRWKAWATTSLSSRTPMAATPRRRIITSPRKCGR